MTPGPRFCSRCGAPIEFNAAFCARCGTPQGPPPPVQAPPPAQPYARPGPAPAGPIPREHHYRHQQGPPPQQYGPPPQQYPPQGPPPQQAYGPPPGQPYQQPPAQYGAPPPQGYYGAPPPPQKPAMSGLAIAGTICAMGAYFCMLIGGMLLVAPCGVGALILGGIGCGIGGALWNSDRPRAKMILAMSTIAIVTTLIIVVMVLWMLHVI